jgi:hypothetical protein
VVAVAQVLVVMLAMAVLEAEHQTIRVLKEALVLLVKETLAAGKVAHMALLMPVRVVVAQVLQVLAQLIVLVV